MNPLIEGDDDLVVGVQETMLAGADDFLVVTAVHTVIMDDPQVQSATARFLQEGHFVSAQNRHPLPEPAAAPDANH